MSEDRSKLIMTTQIAESAERYQDMTVAMKKVTEMGGLLTEDERNYLSVAYKNVVGSKRSSWRILKSIEDKLKENGSEERKLTLTTEYKVKVEKELKDICAEVLDLLTKFLIPNIESARKANEEESVKADLLKAYVFYLKMKGDYYRYLAEFDSEDSVKANSEASYQAAYDACCADDGMEATDPIRLGLALNFSVFFYEIRSEQGKACDLAKKAFDDAIARLDNLSEDSYKDSTLIMQLLRDNLTLWTEENPNEQNGS